VENPIVARYDADAADYERYWAPVLRETARRLLEHVDDFVAQREGRVRMLEVGAGTGSLVLAALERWPDAEVVATDAAKGMLDLARRRVLEARPGESRVSFVHSPAESLDVPAGSVDLVLSTFVLQLVPHRPTALTEAHRVLKPGGMVSYLTWLDRDSSKPFKPADEFDEAVYDLGIEEPDAAAELHAGDVRSARAAADELRRAGFRRASASEDELAYHWTRQSYLDYKFAYDERFLLSGLTPAQQQRLKKNARERLWQLPPGDFRWHAPVVFARALKPGG
jgi:ubiquinone/menaquinone biosynthesis C-methylase UbiE